jgi:hypothetical protein
MSITITEFEKKLMTTLNSKVKYKFPTSPRRCGAIPNLKNAGLVKTYKKPTTLWASKKHTFIKTIKETDLKKPT